MKEIQMTFRVEPELRTSFIEAAELEHRPAAQVLRELMRRYVNEMRGHSKERLANDLVSASERRSREESANFARASIALEGLHITEEDEVLTRRFIAGEIELKDAIKAVHESVKRR